MTRRQLQVRWLLTEDLPSLVSLELDVAPDPWSVATYREFLQARNQIAQVALVNDELLGALACRLERATLYVERLLIAPGKHWKATFNELLVAIRNKLNSTRSCAEILVHECYHTQLVALHKNGFYAVSLVRDHFRSPSGGARDGILMRHAPARSDAGGVVITNRLTEYLAQGEA
jgi:hypothetical protein